VLPTQLGPALHAQQPPPPPLGLDDQARLNGHPDAPATRPEGGSTFDRRRGVSFHPAPTAATPRFRLSAEHPSVGQARACSGRRPGARAEAPASWQGSSPGVPLGAPARCRVGRRGAAGSRRERARDGPSQRADSMANVALLRLLPLCQAVDGDGGVPGTGWGARRSCQMRRARWRLRQRMASRVVLPSARLRSK
jgi:hypothetical protein